MVTTSRIVRSRFSTPTAVKKKPTHPILWARLPISVLWSAENSYWVVPVAIGPLLRRGKQLVMRLALSVQSARTVPGAAQGEKGKADHGQSTRAGAGTPRGGSRRGGGLASDNPARLPAGLLCGCLRPDLGVL